MSNKRYKVSPKKTIHKKFICFTALVAIAFSVFSFSTLALIISSTQAIENQFKLQTTDIEIVEDFKDGDTVKENVCVQNTGEASMYIRVALVEELTNTNGFIIPNKGEKSYFTYENLTGANWIKADDGYYYYSKALKQNQFTSMLFTKAEPSYTVNDGEKLSLNVIAEAIQVSGIEKWTNVAKNANGTLRGD